MQEEWRGISGFQNYEISNLGRVRNAIYCRVLKPSVNYEGYLTIKLFKNGIGTNKRVHRLVADAFIENPFGKPQINHIDHGKMNNAVENLEWVTPQENTDHEIRSGTNKTRNSQLKSNSKYRGGGRVMANCVTCKARCENAGQHRVKTDCISYIPKDYPKPQTNADRIRAMSDEELDKFLGEVQWDVANYCGGIIEKQEYPVPEQRGAWLDWLGGRQWLS